MIDKNKIEKIVGLSKNLGNDPNKIIDMMQHHTEEIKQLYKNKDKHFAFETGDLVVLALELLMMEGYSIEEIMEKCYKRFDKKLNQIIKERNVN